MTMDPARRYALTLHALSAVDRDWILGRLSPAARKRLLPLMDELKGLGLRIDRNLLATLVDGGGLEATSRVINDEDSHHHDVRLLDRADSQWVAAVLQSEPVVLRRAVENAHEWSWATSSKSHTATTATGSGSSVSALAHHIGPTPRVRAALIAQLARRMMTDEQSGQCKVFATSAVTPVRRNRWNSVIGRWLPWAR